MASAARHRAWAAQNEAHYRDILKNCPQALDWAITVLFYACVHEANAFLRARGQPVPGGHAAMKAALDADPAWHTLEQMYELFQGWSNRCRYKLWMPTATDVQLAEVQLGLLRNEIQRLNTAEGIVI